MELPTLNIDKNTYLAYKSPDIHEKERKIKAEVLNWGFEHPKTLTAICIEKICEQWAGLPKLENFIPKDRELFLEILNTEIALQILADNIQSDAFWKRCYYSKWTNAPLFSKSRPWINIFMEKYYAEMLQNMNPRHYDPERITELVNLCGPYIRMLSIQSLIPVDILEQRTTSPEMADLVTSQQGSGFARTKPVESVIRDHISLNAALGSLNFLTEFHIIYQQTNVGVNYRKDQFQFTINDSKNLAHGLGKCQQLKVLRITRSDMDCQRLKYILRGLSENQTLETLDFSHCKISDDGALSLSKFIGRHDKLKNLIIADNLLGPQGAEFLSHSLNHSSCGIRTLDLRLNNKLGSDGVAHIAVSIARGCNLTSINLSGCGIKPGPLAKAPTGVWSSTTAENPPTCGELLARAIGLVKTPLRSFDISVNDIGAPSDQALSNAICLSYIVDINVKRSGMSSVAMAVAESAAATQRLRREAEKGIRFRRSAGRVVQARRVVKGMNMDADPVLFAQQLSARPSIVSITSEEGTYNIQTQPLPSDFSFVPMLKLQNSQSPLPSSRDSSITGPPTSRRSSHHHILEPVKEVLRTALVRRGSDGSLLKARSDNSQRHIKIFVSNEKTKTIK